jgi:transposase
MAKWYRPVQRDQVFLLPACMRDWLSADHPVWLVIRVVEEHLDTAAVHAARRTGGAGAAGYDPDMLLTVLVWAYAHQVTSSRRIEQLCGTDVAFRVICGGELPDHVTIARFRAALPGVIAELFAEVLRLCARLGMGKLGVVALDGTKIRASAGKSANRAEDKLAELAAERVAAHAAADAAEDGLLGVGRRGDEVPEDAWSPRYRDQRIAAAVASLRAEREAAEAERARLAGQYLDAAAAGAPRPGPPPAGTEAELARMQADRLAAGQQAKRDAWDAAAATAAAAGEPVDWWRRPVPAAEYCRVRQARARLDRAIAREAAAAAAREKKDNDRAGPGPVRNITDPDSRLMPVRGGGFIQGYNAQNLVSEDGLIIATRLTTDTTDNPWFTTMLADAEHAAAIITGCQPHHTTSTRAGNNNGSGSGSGSDGSGSDGSDGDGSGGNWRAAGYQPPAADGQPGYAGPIGLLLADAGYCSEHNITTPGPPRLIATGKLRTLEKAARDTTGQPQPASPVIAAMAAQLKTGDGITAYRKRGHIAETPHGNIKHNHAFRQLSVRGKPKASAEWAFAAAVHNLFKAITSGHLTTQALDNLASQAS